LQGTAHAFVPFHTSAVEQRKDTMKEAEIQDLESRLKELARAIGDLGDGSDVENLIPIIHRPGWTTLPEFTFVAGTTEALTAQVRTVNELKRTLVEGAGMIAEAAGHSVTSTAR
jgi:hypothetical protein